MTGAERTGLVLLIIAAAWLPACSSKSHNEGTGGASGAGGAGGTSATGGAGGFSPRKVFVSSKSYLGNELASDPCPDLAVKAGLGPSFRAWLSDSQASAKDKLVPSPDGWETLSYGFVASSLSTLVDGEIAAPIDFDEYAIQVPGITTVWTGTNATGAAAFADAGALDCAGWTSNAVTTIGEYGEASATDSGWTAAGADVCSEPRRVYCFGE